MRKNLLDVYVSNLDISQKRKNSGLNGSKCYGSDSVFRGFKRIKDTVSGTTYGYDDQRLSDAHRYNSVESGSRLKGMGLNG